MSNQALVFEIDLGGQLFDIDQDFIMRYPESIFAKSLDLIDRENRECIKIDRDGENFAKILEFIRDKDAIKMSQKSHVEIYKLLNDAKFFGIDELVVKCEKELTMTTQRVIECAPDEKSLMQMLVGETRLVIILDFERIVQRDEANYFRNLALGLVDRDRCRIVSCRGPIRSYYNWQWYQIGKRLYASRKTTEREEDQYCTTDNWFAALYDPVSDRMLLGMKGTINPQDLVQMVDYANRRYTHLMMYSTIDNNDTYPRLIIPSMESVGK